ncbi:MAG: bifunctional 5,10-methylenetetrahydrofolate dehydrogenase/5,10-methenyltetrahydrofolate cyclohydrolase [Holosporaceae bacterium]|jgi:methylenetetrahydrofolate dehydrogenase (NADP+)/methenyltetrahydrofolate cyclohydrolase|nr:bifunctional 5,10-methylenetetrahydrofolate dehydrogenase/5,10-methenyltetrahydrofolate cyclohydrolase [Holosporaceae bacterium]
MISTKIVNGKEIADKFCEEIKEKVSKIKQRGIFPTVALINVGDDSASNVYISKKQRIAEAIGISSRIYKFTAHADENELAELIWQLNTDDDVHAILLQSPLPPNIEFRKLVDLIRPDKDVDGLTTVNQGKLFSGASGSVPCTSLGILHLLRTVHKKLEGLHAVVLGRSFIVGRPLSQLLLNANCTVTVIHSFSKNITNVCKTADVLISAIGKPRFVTKNFIKQGATIIDVGINRVEENGKKRIVGDVDLENTLGIAGAITPVPNGVGPMTVAYLMHNTLELTYCR